MLYLSQFLQEHRATYYELLQRVRQDGDWEAWLDFFYQGIAETGDDSVIMAKSLLALFNDDRKAIQSTRMAASVVQTHPYLQGHPIASSGAICKAEGLSPATVNKGLDQRVGLGRVKETTGAAQPAVCLGEGGEDPCRGDGALTCLSTPIPDRSPNRKVDLEEGLDKLRHLAAQGPSPGVGDVHARTSRCPEKLWRPAGGEGHLLRHTRG